MMLQSMLECDLMQKDIFKKSRHWDTTTGSLQNWEMDTCKNRKRIETPSVKVSHM